jgi:hypothetical protein
VVMGCVSRPLNLSSVKDADRQPLVTTGAGGGYLPIGYLPTGYLPTGAGAGGGGSLRGRSAAAAALRRVHPRCVCVPSPSTGSGHRKWIFRGARALELRHRPMCLQQFVVREAPTHHRRAPTSETLRTWHQSRLTVAAARPPLWRTKPSLRKSESGLWPLAARPQRAGAPRHALKGFVDRPVSLSGAQSVCSE